MITYQQGEELSRELDIKFFETSAKVNYSVEEAFIALAMIIKESCDTPPTPTPLHPPAASPALVHAGRHASGTTRAADAALCRGGQVTHASSHSASMLDRPQTGTCCV